MADPQFEEFSTGFENLPQHIKASSNCYQIAHGIDAYPCSESTGTILNMNEKSVSEKNSACCFETNYCNLSDGACCQPSETVSVQRKRRKLPQIPVDKEPLSKFRKWPKLLPVSFETANGVQNASAPCDKQYELIKENLYLEIESASGHIKPYLRVRRTKPFLDEACTPEDLQDRCNDVDSGHSSSHSPDGVKSFSPACHESSSCSSSGTLSSLPSTTALQVHDATHRGLYKFFPRHSDEIEVDIGDPVYVNKEADDFWCEGVNLRTGCSGIFPSAYVTDMEYSDFDSDGVYVKRERYLLDFLGSLEVTSHKGNQVLLQAVRKILKSQQPQSRDQVHPCVLEISDNGLRMVDRSKKSSSDVPNQDYFFNLKNVTFCGYHPGNHRYFGFVTKHPLKHKFACHVFMGQSSTRDVAEAVGRAFQRFYQKFMETMYPIEDIYIE